MKGPRLKRRKYIFERRKRRGGIWLFVALIMLVMSLAAAVFLSSDLLA